MHLSNKTSSTLGSTGAVFLMSGINPAKGQWCPVITDPKALNTTPPPEWTTNFADVGNAIRTFENRSEGTGFPPRVWVDVEINQVVNLGDIQFIVNAFEGVGYADVQLELIGKDPADCP